MSKGESYRERNYMDIDYLTWTYGTHGQITSHMSAGDVLHTHSEDIEGDIAQTKVFEELREYYSPE